MDVTKSIELKLGSTLIVSNVSCNDGNLSLYMSKNGSLTLVTSHNSNITSTDYLLDFSNVAPFVTGLIGVPLETRFNATFGLRELSVFKEHPILLDSDTPIPMIVHTEPLVNPPVSGTVSVSGASNSLVTTPSYNLYLTLTGTWVGTVRLQKSIDNGVNWHLVTSHSGTSVYEFTQNCDEALFTVTDPKARYRLQFVMTSGSVTYRLAQ